MDQKSHPKLMGYAMGHKICEQYYDRSSDKSKALPLFCTAPVLHPVPKKIKNKQVKLFGNELFWLA